MPGGKGRPQQGMSRKNHHDSLSQSGQQRRGSSGSGSGGPKYTPSKPQRSILDDLLFGRSTSGKGKKKR